MGSKEQAALLETLERIAGELETIAGVLVLAFPPAASPETRPRPRPKSPKRRR